MKFDPDVQHRRSIRLQRYDYSCAGAYFVTICTQNRECLFGEMVDGAMRLNAAGKVVEECWQEIPSHFPHVELDEFVVMPNHVHGILVIGDPVVATEDRANNRANDYSPLRKRPSGTSRTIGSTYQANHACEARMAFVIEAARRAFTAALPQQSTPSRLVK